MSPFCRQVQRQIFDTALAPFYQSSSCAIESHWQSYICSTHSAYCKPNATFFASYPICSALERWNARVIKIDGFESRSKLPERCYSFCKKSWTAMSLDANGFLSIGTSRSEPCVITKCSQQIEGNLYKSVVKRFTHLG